jgi:hypothetical protein
LYDLVDNDPNGIATVGFISLCVSKDSEHTQCHLLVHDINFRLIFEQMMALMRFVDQHKDDETYCAAWLPEGKSFVVRNPDEFARVVVPKFFKATKFSSFTRKLYRWGFRQINRGIGPDDPVIFGNEFFDRDNEAIMAKMRSVTAAGTRKSDTRPGGTNPYGKRPFDGNMYDINVEQQKRFLYEQYLQQQTNSQMMHQNPSLYGGMSTNGSMPTYQPHMMAMNKPYEMMQPQGTPTQHMMNTQYIPMQQQPQLEPQQQQQQHQHQHQQQMDAGLQNMGQPQGMGPSPGAGHNQGYMGASNNTGSQNTAEIVNAAIRALQYSS